MGSQVVLKTTLQPKSRGRGFRGGHRGGRDHGDSGGSGVMNKSILCNILKQIVAKVGNRLWIVQRPKGMPNHTMLVGADVFHNTGQGKKSIVGFCASMDRFFTHYASIPYAQEELGQEIMYSIGKLMYQALKEYKRQNDDKLPDLIIFYRDGVGESQIPLLINIEIPEIKKAFKKFGDDYKPKFAEPNSSSSAMKTLASPKICSGHSPTTNATITTTGPARSVSPLLASTRISWATWSDKHTPQRRTKRAWKENSSICDVDWLRHAS